MRCFIFRHKNYYTYQLIYIMTYIYPLKIQQTFRKISYKAQFFIFFLYKNAKI